MADVPTGDNRVSHMDWRKGQLATEAAEWQDVIRKRRESMVSFLPSCLMLRLLVGRSVGRSLCGISYTRVHSLSVPVPASLCGFFLPP